jgi:hypothetical protein
MSLKSIVVSIPSWDKYNPRSDRTNYSWFRFENRFFHDQTVFKLGANSKLLVVFVFCEISANAGKPTELNFDYISALLNIRKSQIVKMLVELKVSGLILFDDADLPSSRRHRDVIAQPKVGLRDDTNERTIRDDTVAARAKAAPIPKSKVEVGPTPIGQIRDAFLESYQKEFGHEYAGWGAKENGQTANWLKSVSLEKALDLCRIYPAWNDPKITSLGHPYGLLITDYVRLDAWSRSPERRISKLAQGRAAERVDIKRATEREESKRGLEYRFQQDAEDLRDSRESERTLSHSPPKEIPRISGQTSLAEVQHPRGKANASAGG